MVEMMIAGTAFQMLAQYGANVQQSIYEAQNAQIYAEQASLARAATERELDIASRQYAYQYGSAVGGYASANVDVGSGSALDVTSSIVARKMEELSAIKRQGELNARIASARGLRAQAESEQLGSLGYNLTQGIGTGVANATQYFAHNPEAGSAALKKVQDVAKEYGLYKGK